MIKILIMRLMRVCEYVVIHTDLTLITGTNIRREVSLSCEEEDDDDVRFVDH